MACTNFCPNQHVRPTYHCLFANCTDARCKHCSSSPVRAHNFMAFLQKSNGRMFTPTFRQINDGHCLTFKECVMHFLDLKIPCFFQMQCCHQGSLYIAMPHNALTMSSLQKVTWRITSDKFTEAANETALQPALARQKKQSATTALTVAVG